MNTGRKRTGLPYIPGYTENAVLKLIFFLAGAYIMLAISWAVVMLVYTSGDNFTTYFLPNIALPKVHEYRTHWWTILTYGIFHFPNSFMELLSNMLWLYCFGSVMQMLVGKAQVVPLYLYSIVAGGALYLLTQLLPGAFADSPPLIMGPRAGLMGMAAAAYTLTPKYRFYLTETFSIPIAVVAGVFAVLMIVGSGFYMSVIAMLAGGGLTGFAYIKLLQAGYRPGAWMFSITSKIESLVTPNEQAIRQKQNSRRGAVLNNMQQNASSVSQKRIDDILDKINQKGYNSLSAEEKDLLMKAGKE